MTALPNGHDINIRAVYMALTAQLSPEPITGANYLGRVMEFDLYDGFTSLYTFLSYI